MPNYCVVGGCRNVARKELGISTYFPKNSVIRRAWVRFVNQTRADFRGPGPGSVVCSRHFKDSCFEVPSQSVLDCRQEAMFNTRMTKALTEMDGPSWREKLPPIPTVPMPVKEKFLQTATSNMTAQQNNLNGNKQTGGDLTKAKLLKEEGNAFVKKGQHKKAVEKYTQSLNHDPTEVTTYTNRALCYLSLQMYKEAVKDCEEALQLDPANVKALYRRAQAHKELKTKRPCVEDLNSLLKIEPNNTAAQKLLQEVLKMK